MLSLNNIVKQFDDYKANDGISFDIPKAAVFGLLGPNGAGKTTLIRIITGITAPDSGTVTVDGKAFAFEDRSLVDICQRKEDCIRK